MNLLKKITLFTLLFVLTNSVFASSMQEDTKTEKEGFEPGELIMEHIGDAYEWHVATFGDFH
ncbi:MAG: F0F1 ATP synthase subunit A, partial [Bacteroidales bacterium]|nr:F0F1 ATP synthase subunit A [Bacteroidales bacterium]